MFFTPRSRMFACTAAPDRKSTRLNSSHRCNSYAVFCLKKKTEGTSESQTSTNYLFFTTMYPLFEVFPHENTRACLVLPAQTATQEQTNSTLPIVKLAE